MQRRHKPRPRDTKIKGMKISKSTAQTIKAIQGWNIAKSMKNWYLHADDTDIEQPN